MVKQPEITFLRAAKIPGKREVEVAQVFSRRRRGTEKGKKGRD